MSVSAPAIPTTLDELLEPEWLTAALGIRFPGVQVTKVTPGPVVERVSTNARFTIESASPLPAGLPPRLCAKGYFSETGRSTPGVGEVEASFYRELAPVSGVRTLHSVYADVDAETHHGVVISADVIAAGGEFLDALSPFTPEQVSQSLEQYATLHARTWDDDHWMEQAWLRPKRSSFMVARGLPDIEYNFTGPNGAGVPTEVRDAQRLLDAYKALIARQCDAEARSVVHGDAHIGNLFLDGDRQPCLIDWQMVSHGPWALDVGYHIASALPVDDRERTERDLLRHYLDNLRARGAEPPPWDDAWDEYRRGIVYGFFLWGITRLVAPPIIAELLHRLGSAARAHDSFGALDV
jgi:phosphotransferase family enzyme